MVNQSKIKAFLMAVLLISGSVLAQDAPKLVLTIDEAKVNMTAGELSGEEAIVYAPGDTIQYSIIAKNEGTGLLKNAVINDPIPAGAKYVEGTAEDDNADVFYSADNQKNFSPWPPFYKVRNAFGFPVKKIVGANEVTHIKWELHEDIVPGDSTVVEFQVVVQ